MIAALELARAVPLVPACAFAIGCQLLAIVYFVERLKGVDRDVAGGPQRPTRDLRARLERQDRAGYGLAIDLSLYLLAVEIVLAFVVMVRA